MSTHIHTHGPWRQFIFINLFDRDFTNGKRRPLSLCIVFLFPFGHLEFDNHEILLYSPIYPHIQTQCSPDPCQWTYRKIYRLIFENEINYEKIILWHRTNPPPYLTIKSAHEKWWTSNRLSRAFAVRRCDVTGIVHECGTKLMLRTLLISQNKSSSSFVCSFGCLPPRSNNPHTHTAKQKKKCVTLHVLHTHSKSSLPQFATAKVVHSKCHCITTVVVVVIVFHFIIFTFKSSSRKLTQKFNFLFFFGEFGGVRIAASATVTVDARATRARTHTFDCIFMVISFVRRSQAFSRAVNVLTFYFYFIRFFSRPFSLSPVQHPPSYLKWSNKHFWHSFLRCEHIYLIMYK